MAITSIGYDGSVNEAQWAKMIPSVGSSQYGVVAAGDWKVTPHSTMDRGVNIAIGSGWGHGVLDTSDATVSLQGALVSSGDRWDMVVMRRNWAGVGGVSTFVLVQGTAVKQLPSRNNTPGTLDDQPLALVRFTAGQTAAQEIIDLRCWGRNGGLAARDELALTYLKEPGASITVGDEVWNCIVDGNGNVSWSSFVMGRISLFGVGGVPPGNAVPPAGTEFLVQTGCTVLTTDANAFGKLVYPQAFPNGLLSIQLMNADDYSFNDMGIAPAGSNWGTSPANRIQCAFQIWGASGGVRTKNWPNRSIRIHWTAIGW